MKGKTVVSFHTRSLPTARLVWHCPFIVIFTSDNALVNGPNFREFGLIRLDGETWLSDTHAQNIIEAEQPGTSGDGMTGKNGIRRVWTSPSR